MIDYYGGATDNIHFYTVGISQNKYRLKMAHYTIQAKDLIKAQYTFEVILLRKDT